MVFDGQVEKRVSDGASKELHGTWFFDQRYEINPVIHLFCLDRQFLCSIF
jgi:hypothetical protein